MSGPRVYIHEFVYINGHNRSRYFHHITANWSPIGQREREQLCFGIWGTVGSTARWPEVVNMWEYRDWAHLAENFRIEFDHPTLQDPSLADWWAAAEQFRSGGWDRVPVAADYSPSVGELTAAGTRGAVYAEELLDVEPGSARTVLDLVQAHGIEAHAEHGATLIGAYRTGLVDDREVILIWALPDWDSWGRFEQAQDGDGLGRWRERIRTHVRRTHRFLMVDAPLSPLRTGRQPQESDREALPGR